MASEEAILLRVLVGVMGRVAFPEEKLRAAVAPRGGDKQVRAYNLCDGTRTQSEVAKEAEIDQGQLSKAVGAWVQAGIVHRVPDGKELRLLHLYPLAETTPIATERTNGRQKSL